MMAQAQAGTPRTRVVWTDEERNKIALRAYEHQMEHSATDSWIESLQEAQNLLMETDKLRPKSSLYSESQNMKTLGAKLYRDKQANTPALAQALVAAQAAQEKPVPVPPLKLVQAPAPATAPVEAQPVQAELAPFEREFTLMSKVVGSFVDKIGEEFRRQLTAKLEQVTGEVLAQHDIKIAEHKIVLPAIKHKSILPKILIVGMLPKHATQLHKEYDQFFDLEFLEVDKVNQLKSKANGKDRVIINTSFINDQVWDTVRKHPGLIPCAGNGLVADKLLELACNAS